MGHARSLLPLVIVLSLAGSACKSEPPAPKHTGFARAPMGTAAPRVCTFGEDQTCNDETLMSSIHGACSSEGTCTCQPGFAINPQTGRCK